MANNTDKGIYLWDMSHYNNLIDNTVANNTDYGIELENSDYNSLTSNTVSGNTGTGIELYYYSRYNNLTSNTVADNTGTGIELGYYSDYNNLTSNTVSDNTGIGIELGYCSGCNSLTSNTVANNTDKGIYLYSGCNNLTSNTVSGNTGTGIELGYYSDYNNLTSNTVSDNTGTGIYLYDANYNNLTSNTVEHNNYGIFFDIEWMGSRYNILTNNTLKDNNYGVYLLHSNNNLIYNNYFNNTIYNVDDSRSHNFWNITITEGTNIIGGPNLGGNYWSDYEGVDTDGDGLGNTLLPHKSSGGSSGGIVNGGDHHPLVLVVPNRAPTADANGPYTAAEGSVITLDASGSSDPDSNPLQYRWDFDNDGNWNTGWLTDPTFDYTWTDEYDGDIAVEVNDSEFTSIATASVTISNVAPAANAGPDQTVYEGETVSFSGSFTDPGADDTHTFEWDFGDGNTNTTSLTPTHVYAENGTYTVTLTVTDDELDDGTDTLIVTVSNVAPVVDAGADQTVYEGETVSFSGSFTDPGADDTHTFEWDFGDGNTNTTSLTPTHVYAENGTYTVTLTVTDDDLDVGTDTTTVTVKNVLKISATCPVDLEVVDPEGLIINKQTNQIPGATYEETDISGDGDPDDIISVPYKEGNYQIEIIPEEGATGYYTLEVSIGDTSVIICENAPVSDITTDHHYTAEVTTDGDVSSYPIADARCPSDPVKINSPIAFDGSYSYDPDGAPLEYYWDFDSDGEIDSTDPTDSTPDHAYAEPGVYTVTLTVTDGDGNSKTDVYQYVVVYDPNGGFVTGGGWIDSPAGAYVKEPTLGGEANFGFVSKYKKGSNVPTGQTQFQFKVADLDFHSDSYDWLVVAGHRATYKGTGTINGEGNYGFMISAIDAELTPSTDVDLFRIKIWDKATDEVIYDNKNGAADDADPTTEIQGGNIKIHKAK